MSERVSGTELMRGETTERVGPGRARPWTVIVAVGVAIVSVGLCAVLAVLQVLDRGTEVASSTPVEASSGGSTPTNGSQGEATDGSALLAALPSDIEGFRTSARQEVPGFEGRRVEALYTPLAEEVSVRFPLNVYVSMTSVADASGDEAAELMGGSEETVQPPELSGAVSSVTAVRQPDAYLIVWQQDGLLVAVDTRFTIAVPAEPGELLETHGTVVAQAVAEQLGR